MVSFQSDAAPAVTTSGGRTNHGLIGAGEVACRAGRGAGGVTCLDRCSSDSAGGLSLDCARAKGTTSKPEPAIRMANAFRGIDSESFQLVHQRVDLRAGTRTRVAVSCSARLPRSS